MAYLTAIEDVRRYMNSFLRGAHGGYFVSQDADLVQGQKSHAFFALNDAERRKLGIPRVDQNVYAQENGWAIEGLADVARHTGNEAALADALAAVRHVENNLRRADGGFAHSAGDTTGPYLGDNLAMARAYLALFRATGDSTWLTKSKRLTRYLHETFADQTGGYLSGADNNTPVKPVRNIDENVTLGLHVAALAQAGDGTLDDMARHVMRYLVPVAKRRTIEVGIAHVDQLLAAARASSTNA